MRSLVPFFLQKFVVQTSAIMNKKVNQNLYSKEEGVRYSKLSAIDAKCGSLLQLTSLLLVFLSMSSIYDDTRRLLGSGTKFLFIGLLVSCIISLFVLFFKEDTSEQFVDFRKHALNTAVIITSLCCIIVVFMVYHSL
jgi:FtsH-binding integral membrane protein